MIPSPARFVKLAASRALCMPLMGLGALLILAGAALAWGAGAASLWLEYSPAVAEKPL